MMQTRFPEDFEERIIISCDPAYKRATDVDIQSALAFADGTALHNQEEAKKDRRSHFIGKADPLIHMYHIIKAYKHVLDYKKLH